MANRVYQGYTLFQALKAAKPGSYVTKEELGKALGVNPGSIPVYFIGLRDWFGVEIVAHKDGRTVVGYELVTRDIDVPMHGRRSASKGATKTAAVKKPKTAKATKPVVEKVAVKATKKPKATKPEADEDIFSDMEVTEITDNELSDIRSQLGL